MISPNDSACDQCWNKIYLIFFPELESVYRKYIDELKAYYANKILTQFITQIIVPGLKNSNQALAIF